MARQDETAQTRDERAERLAAALRENLKRRRAQARARRGIAARASEPAPGGERKQG
jgi:hypothetical protein